MFMIKDDAFKLLWNETAIKYANDASIRTIFKRNFKIFFLEKYYRIWNICTYGRYINHIWFNIKIIICYY